MGGGVLGVLVGGGILGILKFLREVMRRIFNFGFGVILSFVIALGSFLAGVVGV